MVAMHSRGSSQKNGSSGWKECSVFPTYHVNEDHDPVISQCHMQKIEVLSKCHATRQKALVTCTWSQTQCKKHDKDHTEQPPLPNIGIDGRNIPKPENKT